MGSFELHSRVRETIPKGTDQFYSTIFAIIIYQVVINPPPVSLCNSECQVPQLSEPLVPGHDTF